MILVHCVMCTALLTEPGGLLFSPPEAGNHTAVRKDHLCKNCYNSVIETISRYLDPQGEY